MSESSKQYNGSNYPNLPTKSSALMCVGPSMLSTGEWIVKALLVHEQGQTPDSLKRWYENASLGQKWLILALFTNCSV
jgi:hypothetical protein